MAWEPRFTEPKDEIDRLIDELCAAVDRSGLGCYEIRFFKGGHVLIDLNAKYKKPAKRRNGP